MDFMSKLRGVNLGGWLILEKWMTPGIFAGTSAVDEYTFCKDADQRRLDVLRQHRDSFITEADFKWMADHGLTAVRLPVGYWSFGGVEPYQECAAYIDKVFEWAAKYRLQVLVCVHGAPGSQNGQDHSGRSGPIEWGRAAEDHTLTVAFAGKLAERYGKHPALYGIELMNEPSRKVPKRLLKRYYRAAYHAIRRAAKPECRILVSDGFQAWRWPFVLARPAYRHTLMDTHRYAIYLDRDKRRPAHRHVTLTRWWLPIKLLAMRLTHKVVVGEWSAALDEQSLQGLDEAGRDQAYRMYAAAQLAAYDRTAGWFYWSYKTENPGPWDYRHCVHEGWLPEFH